MDAKRKLMLAVALGTLWAGLAVWQWKTWQEPVRVPLTNVTGQASSAQQERLKADGLRVNLELLESARTQRQATFTMPRNIFAPLRLDGTPAGGQGEATLKTLDPNSEQALQQQAASVELLQYRYLGFLRMSEGRKRNKDMAVLSKNEDVVVVKVGDRFEDHLRLKTITPENVIIQDLVARIEQTVPLSEELPVQP